MQRIIIILIVLLNYIPSLLAQSAFDLELLSIEQNVFVAKTDTERAPLILKKFDLYVQHNELSINAAKEARRIDYTLLPNDESKKHFLWNAAIIANLTNDADYASFYIDRYHKLNNDSSVQYILLDALINNGRDSALLNESAKKLERYNTSFSCITCLNEVAYYEKKNRNKYLVSSAIIPGLGSMMLGYPFKGVSSLVINAASAFAIYSLVKSNLYVNAVLWGITLTTKFYIGNIKLTNKLFEDKEAVQKNTLANKCKGKVSELLKEYPILFK